MFPGVRLQCSVQAGMVRVCTGVGGRGDWIFAILFFLLLFHAVAAAFHVWRWMGWDGTGTGTGNGNGWQWERGTDG